MLYKDHACCHVEMNFPFEFLLMVIMSSQFRLSIDVMDEIEELILIFMMHFIMLAIKEYVSTRCIREVRTAHYSTLQGNTWLMEVLHNSSPVRCRGSLCMKRHMFIRFCDELRSKNYLEESRYVKCTNKYCFYLQWVTIVGTSSSRCVPTSRETISRYFHALLRVVASFVKEMIRLPSLEETPPKILKNMKYYPWFKDCFGTINGRNSSWLCQQRKLSRIGQDGRTSARRMSWLFALYDVHKDMA